jgi:alanine racemase
LRSSSPLGSALSSAALAQVEVDLAALRRNVERLRKVAAPARFAAVVKSNAYGHGLRRVAQALEGDVDLLCVYRVEEGYEVREAGVRTPVLVLGPVPPRELPATHAANLAITLWDSGSYLADAARTAREAGTPLRVHAKIDTGATRLGMSPERAAIAISEMLGHPAFELEGAFTHLAAVEELESSYTLEQLERFDRALQPVAAALKVRGALRHAAASAAAMLFPRARLDLVRVGISTYGLWPSPETRDALQEPIVLEPALSWRSTLVTLRDVPAGTSVGYGCTFRTERPSRIGVLPIGYAEGIPRAVSNRGAVLVAGARAPIVGRVCMNMTMVDVTDIPQARPGSVVTLIGSDGAESLGAEDWGRWAETIDYEIVARLPAELPRIYRDDRSSSD